MLGSPTPQLAPGAAPASRLQDVWSGSALHAAANVAAGVPAHGTVVYRAARLESPEAALQLPPSLSLGGSLGTLTAGSSEAVALNVSARNHGLGEINGVQLLRFAAMISETVSPAASTLFR